MMKSWRLALVGALLLAAGAAYGDDWVDPSRVLVVYNGWDDVRDYYGDFDDDGLQDSEAVAWYYVLRRGIPADNLLELKCANNSERTYWYGFEYQVGTNQWGDFWLDIVAPIQQKLTALGPQNIDYIVLCHGASTALWVSPTTGNYADRLDVSMAAAIFDLNHLGTLSAPNAADFAASAANPYFMSLDPTGGPDPKVHFDHALTGLSDRYLVTSLDGPEPAVIFDMVEGCIYGDAYVENGGNYEGKVYIEQYDGESPPATYPSTHANVWTRASQNMNALRTWIHGSWPYDCEIGQGIIGGTGYPSALEQLGQWHASGASGAGPATAAPDAMFLGGWHHNGTHPYNDVWGWLPGSAGAFLMNGPALDRVRLYDREFAFLVNALPKGLCAALGRGSGDTPVTPGSYYDIEFRPEIFVHYITNGYNFAEASYASMQYLKSRVMPCGDPIYCPTYATGKTPDGSALQPTVMLGDGPQANSKMISIYAGTMTSVAPTELYRFRLDVGATQDSLDTVFDYDDCERYSIYQRYIVTQLADGTPLEPVQVYWYRAYAKDPSGNEWQGPLSAFATEGDVSGGTITKVVQTAPTDFVDRWIRKGGDGTYRDNSNMWLQGTQTDNAIYKFPSLPALGSDVLIIKAALSIYWNFRHDDIDNPREPTPVVVRALMSDWNVDEVLWTNKDTATQWARDGISCGGIDTNTTPYTLLPMEKTYYPVGLPLMEGGGIHDNPFADPGTPREIDITGIVRQWYAGTMPNYGVMLDNPQDGQGIPLVIYGDTSGDAPAPGLHIYWCYEPPTVTLDVEAPGVWGVDEGTTQDVILTATTVKPDPARVINRYEWDFDGDGTVDRTTTTPSTTVPETFTYQPSAQAYTATVTVYDDKTNATASVQVIVTTKPVAIIDIPSTYVLVNQPMTLDGSGSYDPDGSPIVSYDWDSAGTPIGSGQTVTYTWTSAGANPVLTLTVNDGLVDGTTSITIHVRDATGMPPGTDVTEADIKVRAQDTGGCLAPWMSVDGVKWPLDIVGTVYEDHTGTATVTIAVRRLATVTMLDASGNSSQLEVEIEETVVP